MSGFDDGGMEPPPPPPPSAGGGGAIPQRGLGDILTAAFELYRANAVKLIQIVAIVVIPLTFISALLTKVIFKPTCTSADLQSAQTLQDVVDRCTVGFFRGALVSAIGFFIAIAIQQLLAGAVTRGGAAATLGRDVDVNASYRYAFSRIGGVIGLALLIGLMVGIGFILFIIPGIIFLVFLSVSVVAFIIERLGAVDSMKRSWALVRGNWWHTLGVIIVTALLAGIVNGILTAIGGDSFLGSWIFSSIAQIITAPYVAVVYVLLYIDLRARHGAVSSPQLETDLAAAQP